MVEIVKKMGWTYVSTVAAQVNKNIVCNNTEKNMN